MSGECMLLGFVSSQQRFEVTLGNKKVMEKMGRGVYLWEKMMNTHTLISNNRWRL